MTDKLLSKLDALAAKAGSVPDTTNHGMFHWLAFAQAAYKAWPAIAKRLRAASAVVEAAAADLKASRDAQCEVFKETDAEWLAGCTTTERALLDAIEAYRRAVTESEETP